MTHLLPRGMIVLASVSLAFLILSVSFLSVFLSDTTYKEVPEEFAEQNSHVLSYLTFGGALEILTENEQAHMRDVRRLLLVGMFLTILSLGILSSLLGVFVWQGKRRRTEELLSRSSWNSGWIILSTCFVLGLALLLSFEKSWMLFHLILFPQGNWMFAADSLLIQMYPGSFFQTFITKFLVRVLSLGVLAILTGLFMDRMTRHERFFKGKVQKAGKHRRKQ